MKKLKLNFLDYDSTEVLSREQLKKIWVATMAVVAPLPLYVFDALVMTVVALRKNVENLLLVWDMEKYVQKDIMHRGSFVREDRKL
ncbi:MAG: hypothetical protein KF862_24885 [Chitinophagaceae bacterium]|nr:hypothetical protein [Chitinophagaceae bacterium]